MAFNKRYLSTIAYVNGWTMWNYITQDTIEQVTEPEYFGNSEKKPTFALAKQKG